MALSATGLYLPAVQGIFKNTLAIDLTNTQAKIALYTATVTPNFSTDVAYSTSNEVSGAGWPAGGVLLSQAALNQTSTAPTFAEGTTRSLRWDMGDIEVAATTLSNISAATIYADYLTPKQPIITILFTGGPYSTNVGTFSIAWASGGLFEIALGGN